MSEQYCTWYGIQAHASMCLRRFGNGAWFHSIRWQAASYGSRKEDILVHVSVCLKVAHCHSRHKQIEQQVWQQHSYLRQLSQSSYGG